MNVQAAIITPYNQFRLRMGEMVQTLLDGDVQSATVFDEFLQQLRQKDDLIKAFVAHVEDGENPTEVIVGDVLLDERVRTHLDRLPSESDADRAEEHPR